MPQHCALDEILRLDPVRDHQRIVFLTTTYEFPFNTTRALEFALFRTFAVPSVSRLLSQTGEFARRPQKRYDDTDLLLSEIYENGYDSERGRAALRRMNRQHGRYTIANGDFLYVMSTFVFEPTRWYERFGWRQPVANEKLAMFYFWREIGKRMHITALPDNYDAFERFNREYERDHFRRAESNTQVGGATRDLFLSWFLPRPLLFLGAPFIYALLDDSLLDAFGFPRPHAIVRRLAVRVMRSRGSVVRVLPERHGPHRRTTLPHRSYPRGYQIEELGPPIIG